MSSPQQPGKPAQAQTPEITEATFTLKDLAQIAKTCHSLEELNAKLREKLLEATADAKTGIMD